jgi:GDP-L-fucose synthase
VVGYSGEIQWDASKPDGAPRKLMDVQRLKDLGWNYRIDLEQGLQDAYRWYLDNQDNYRG